MKTVVDQGDVTNTPRPTTPKREGLAIYVILALGITWLLWMPTLIIASREGYVLPTIDGLISGQSLVFQDTRHVLVSVAFSLAVYGPLVAAIVATLVGGGKGALRELLGRMVRWRVAPRWYLIIVILAVAIPFVPLAIGALAGMVNPKPGALVTLLPAVL